MITYQNLTLIGTSHIAKQSVAEVKKSFLELKPEIVCVELDRQRLHGLLSKKRERPGVFQAIRQVGLKGYAFSLIGYWVEKKLGKIVGVKPGADMMQAVKLARINNIPLGLIDQDITITLRKINKEITFKEKWTFVKEIFGGVFNGLLGRKPEFTFDLNKVPEKEIIKKMTDHLKKNYPTMYKILIKERNEFMANRLKIMMKHEPDKKIMAVVGAGHEEEIMELIKK